MDKGKNEFLGLLCNLYLTALLVVLPLYTGKDGYWKLGDTKYELFRNISLLCLGSWLVLGMPGRIRTVLEKFGIVRGGREEPVEAREADKSVRERHSGKREADESVRERLVAERKTDGAVWERFGRDRKIGAAVRQSFSMVDCAVAAYGLCAAISALCSSYGQLAWIGYNEWYMGGISQLIFVGIYFFVSRQYDGRTFPLYLGEAAIFLVTLFGLLHRLGIDPLGLQAGWNSGDWEYNHMLSTLGNINWLCGFYSAALAFAATHYLQEKRVWLQIPLYITVTAIYVLLGVQGSQGGRLILAVCTVVCVLAGWRRKAVLKKVFLMLTGFFLCMPLMELLTKMRGKMAAVAADGDVFEHVRWYGWVIAAAVSFLSFFILRRKPADGRSLARRHVITGVCAALAGVCIVLAGCLLFQRLRTQGTDSGQTGWFGIDDSFGSGRGFLWRIALEGFRQADGKDKLLGAGPDCYGEAVFQRLGSGTDVWKGEHWEGAVFTNAHNEILSQLINVGILGTACYAAIFLTGLWRYGEQKFRAKEETAECVRWLGLLAIAMYGAHSMISFQQVLNTPLLFAALGLCEYGMRGQRENMEDQDSEVDEI